MACSAGFEEAVLVKRLVNESATKRRMPCARSASKYSGKRAMGKVLIQ